MIFYERNFVRFLLYNWFWIYKPNSNFLSLGLVLDNVLRMEIFWKYMYKQEQIFDNEYARIKSDMQFRNKLAINLVCPDPDASWRESLKEGLPLSSSFSSSILRQLHVAIRNITTEVTSELFFVQS